MRSLIHTIPLIADLASGPTYTVARLCDALVDRGSPILLAALDTPGHRATADYVRRFPRSIGPARLGCSAAMRRWLESEAAANRVSIFHGHSLWMMPNVYPGNVARRHRIPYVVSPHGCFAKPAFERGARIKRLFWPLVQRPSLRSTTLFHATAQSECDDIRRMGYRQPVAVIPNGIDVPTVVPDVARERTILFLARIHRSKGLEDLLRAWSQLAPQRPDWRLRIVGPDNEGHLPRMRALAEELRLERYSFDGPLTGAAKQLAYASASLYVLPSMSENFGVTVAESLSLGTPTVANKGAPWPGLETEGCGWWIEQGVGPLTETLARATALHADELHAMGLRGRLWMERDFHWSGIADRMIRTYEWILSGMPPSQTPSWVDNPGGAPR